MSEPADLSTIVDPKMAYNLVPDPLSCRLGVVLPAEGPIERCQQVS